MGKKESSNFLYFLLGNRVEKKMEKLARKIMLAKHFLLVDLGKFLSVKFIESRFNTAARKKDIVSFMDEE